MAAANARDMKFGIASLITELSSKKNIAAPMMLYSGEA
jgi:hypothetical protein